MFPKQVSILGAAGHIGGPLAVVIADSGFDVYGVDLNEEMNGILNAGRIPYVEHGAEELLQKYLERGTLRFTADNSSLATSAVLVVIMGTPVDDNLNPRVDTLLAVMREHAPRMPRGQLIVLRSTVSPGTTTLIKKVLEDGSGLTEGEDFFLVFAPERVLQTRAVEEIRTLPQLIGAWSDKSFHEAETFFGTFVEKKCIHLQPVEAELGKLITNMARYVSFALANEFYMICDGLQANPHTVIAACNTDYPRLNLPLPGVNVGGPCLYKDGYYLVEHIQYPEIIGASFKINESMPRYLLDRVAATTNLRRVGVLGLAFKANCDDTRNSLSFKLMKQLRSMAIEPVPVDPYVSPHQDLSRLAGVDALFLMTPHREFTDLAPIAAAVNNPDCVVVDTWNLWPQAAQIAHNGIFRLGDLSADSSALTDQDLSTAALAQQRAAARVQEGLLDESAGDGFGRLAHAGGHPEAPAVGT